jgi:hypothetical protein
VARLTLHLWKCFPQKYPFVSTSLLYTSRDSEGFLVWLAYSNGAIRGSLERQSPTKLQIHDPSEMFAALKRIA